MLDSQSLTGVRLPTETKPEKTDLGKESKHWVSVGSHVRKQRLVCGTGP